jgi:hypothetical protein
MDIAFAFLANYAEFAQDGRLTMVNGDLETLLSTRFPTQPFNLMLAVKLMFPAAECERDYQFRVEISNSQMTQAGGQRAPTRIDIPVRPPRNPAAPQQGMTLGFAIQFLGIVFPRDGEYPVRILLDGVEKKTIPLRVINLQTVRPAG